MRQLGQDVLAAERRSLPSEREFFIDNLLVRVYLIIGMILVDWPCLPPYSALIEWPTNRFPDGTYLLH